jgi:hypothetical protein
MADSAAPTDDLLLNAATRLTGHQRRLFQAEVALALCGGSPRRVEQRFGWGRDGVATGLAELRTGIRCLEDFPARGRARWEDRHPGLAELVRDIVEPRTHADPELKSDRRYTRLSAAEVLAELRGRAGAAADLPGERQVREILNRMGYRLKRVRKGKPLKKTAETDAIFANVRAVKEGVKGDPETLEISVDAKAKVAEGEYVRGGKKPDGV